MSYKSLADLRRLVISRFRAEFTKSSDLLTAEQIDGWINEAYLEIQRTYPVWRETHKQTSVADQIGYNAPLNCLDKMIERVLIRTGSGTNDFTPLKHRTWDYMREFYGGLLNPDSLTGPRDWAWSERGVNAGGVEGQETIDIMYPVETGYAEGLLVDYVPRPNTVNTVYDQSVKTAAVTANSNGVTLSADPLDVTIRPDLLFGVKASAAALPTKWYRIATSPTPTQTTFNIFGNEAATSQAYQETTNATALFVISDVSKLELRRPGLIGDAPADYALYYAVLMEEGPEAAEFYRLRWEMHKQRIAALVMRDPGIEFHSGRKDYRHPGLARRLGR